MLAEMPLEQITTSRIAEAAGISVGAVSRIFPGKQEIIDAIAVRHMDEFRARLQKILIKSLLADGPKFLGKVVDAYVAFLDERPDFRAIALGQHVSATAKSQQTAPGAGPGGGPAAGLGAGPAHGLAAGRATPAGWGGRT